MKMNRLALVVALHLCIVVAAFAQNNRSFVSTSGSDANNCTPGFECRSFGRALTMTNPGGEIIAVASGGYGPFTISGPITIMGAPGVAASLTSGTDGIDVAATSTDRVVLRGLNITLTAAGNGINATNFGLLSIENCTLSGGTEVLRVAGPSGSVALISDTVARGATDSGFVILSRASLVRCRAEKDQVSGLLVTDGTSADGIASAVDFVAVGCLYGAYARSFTIGHNAVMDLDRALISHNTYGVAADNLSFVRVAASSVTSNSIAGFYQVGSGVFDSVGNNLVEALVGTIGTWAMH